jgi:hypothetical protein
MDYVDMDGAYCGRYSEWCDHKKRKSQLFWAKRNWSSFKINTHESQSVSDRIIEVKRKVIYILEDSLFRNAS